MSIFSKINWKKVFKTIVTLGFNYLKEYLDRKKEEEPADEPTQTK